MKPERPAGVAEFEAAMQRAKAARPGDAITFDAAQRKWRDAVAETRA